SPDKVRRVFPGLVSVGSCGCAFDGDGDVSALAYGQDLGRGAAVGGDFQVAHAPNDGKYLAGRALGVVGVEIGDLTLADLDFEGRRFRLEKGGNVVRSEIGDQVSEAINLQNDPTQLIVTGRLGARRVEADKVFNLIAKLPRIYTFGKI